MTTHDGPRDPLEAEVPGTESSATESSAMQPVETTRMFVDAVVWGDHEAVWELLGAEGRDTVLKVAVSNGMDQAESDRIRDDSASAGERSRFLVELVYGLRNDLRGNDVDTLEYELESSSADPSHARVVLSARMPSELGGGLPVGSAELSHDGERWRVERLVPRRSLSA
ncbi:MAG: hypothetical protein M3N28_01660 [Actinomycetota bacterium]|nr:hypothetical protein [Actinomycetota bacterium]